MRRSNERSGFTLMELLVVVAIMMFLMILTVSAYNWNADKERIANEARSIASFLEGARDRAIHDKKIVGVRFVLDSSGPVNSDGNTIAANSLQYVEMPDPIKVTVAIDMDDKRTLKFFNTGPDGKPGVGNDDPSTPNVNEADDDSDGRANNHTDEVGFGDDENTSYLFSLMEDKGLLGTEFRATLPKLGMVVVHKVGSTWRLGKEWPADDRRLLDPVTGTWYTADTNGWVDIVMTVHARFPRIRPNEEDRNLARGVVIDLETMRQRNRIPEGWYDSTTNEFVQERMNLLFTPDGQITTTVDLGLAVPTLLVAKSEDVETTVYTGTLYDLSSRPNHTLERFVSISPAGAIRVRPINLVDSNGNGVPDDPFAFADGVD